MDFIDILKVIGIAASPISELRGAIPIAISDLNIPWYLAYLIAVIGNLIPVFLILLCFEPAVRIINHVYIGRRFLDWLFKYVRKRGRHTEKYERIGLALFVAIPLPVTGAWTGSILAALRGYSFKYAFTSIFSGVLIAGVIVTAVWMSGVNIFWLLTH